MNIASLFAKLGIDIDAATFAAADAKLQALQQRAEEVMQRVRSNNEHFDQIVLDTGRAARAQHEERLAWIEDWKKNAKTGIDWTKAYRRTVEGLTKVYRVARAAVIGVFVGGAALKGLGHLADGYTGVRNRLIQLTDDTARQTRLQDSLFKSAQDTAVAYSDVGSVYQQVATAAKANGRSLEQAVVLTDTINKAIKSSGANAEGASRALQQLGQGLGSGTLRGEEFNAVIEQAPVLIDIIAKSMGKTRGEMRKLAEGGQLTAKVILKALEQQKGAIDAAYAKRIPQVGDLFVRLRNTISKALSEVFQKKEVIAGLTAAFKGLAAVLVGVIEFVAAVSLALSRNPELLAAVAGAVAALTAAFIALKIEAAIAWLVALSPIAAVAAGIIALLAVIIIFRNQFGKAIGWIGRQWDGFWRAVDRKIKNFGAGFMAFFRGIGDGIRSAFHYIVNGVIDAINEGIWLLNKAIRLANKLPWVDIGTVGTIDRVGETRNGALNKAAQARINQLHAAAATSSRPSTTLPTRPIATMPSVARRTAAKQVNVNNSGPVNINVNGAGDPKAVAAEVARKYKELRDQDMHAAMAGLDDIEEPT